MTKQKASKKEGRASEEEEWNGSEGRGAQRRKIVQGAN